MFLKGFSEPKEATAVEGNIEWYKGIILVRIIYIGTPQVRELSEDLEVNLCCVPPLGKHMSAGTLLTFYELMGF